MDATAIKAMMSEIAPVIREYVAAENAPLVERSAALEARIAELETQLPVAAPLSVDEVRAIVGEHGPEIVNLTERVAELETREPLLPEKGEPGERGAPGEPGEPGPQGEPGPAGEVDLEAVGQLIVDAVSKAVEALPAPERGERGDDGLPGEKGADGAPGAPGEAGKDGVGLADAFEDSDGRLVLTMTDGRTKTLGVVKGKDGEPGKDGADGITPSFIDAEFVGRTLRLTFDGDRSCEFKMALPEYVGVFKENGTYEQGDMVTWAGSTWHCDEPKGLKPGAPDSGWTLAVKAGRPGKDK